MNDTQLYKTLLTNRGKDLLLAALSNGEAINLTKMKVGDGSIALDTSWSDLPSTKHTLDITTILQGDTPGEIKIEGVILSSIGGFTIRQIGVFTDKNELFAIANVPPVVKPLLSEGSATDIDINFYLEVSDTSVINLTVDPSVVLASKQEVDELRNLISNKLKEVDEKNAKLRNDFNDTLKKFVRKNELITEVIDISKDGVIDISRGVYFRINMTKNITLSLKNEPSIADEPVYHFVLEVLNADKYTLTWFNGISWSKNLAPVFKNNARSVFAFIVSDSIVGINTAKELNIKAHTRSLKA